MFAAEEFYSWDRRENRAIDTLWPSLSQAVATGCATVVGPFSTSLSNAQLVEIAVRLCKRSDSNVAVVGSHDGKTLSFVPLFASTGAVRSRVAAETRRKPARTGAPWSAAGAATAGGSVTI